MFLKSFFETSKKIENYVFRTTTFSQKRKPCRTIFWFLLFLPFNMFLPYYSCKIYSFSSMRSDFCNSSCNLRQNQSRVFLMKTGQNWYPYKSLRNRTIGFSSYLNDDSILKVQVCCYSMIKQYDIYIYEL